MGQGRSALEALRLSGGKLRLWVAALLAGIVSASLRPALADEAAPSFVHFKQFKPVYALLGTPDAKLQLSFKIQPVPNFELYFGYTQLMVWDVYRPSDPMRSVDFDPEFSYRIHLDPAADRWIDLGLFEHESNGRDGNASREWNRVYVLYHSSERLGEQLQALWSIKFWVPLLRKTNRDIAQYRGIWEGEFTLRNFLGPFFGENTLALRFYPGGPYLIDPLKGGRELTFRFKTAKQALGLMYVAQVFQGYGENLYDYRQSRFGVRAGVGF